MAVAGAVVSIVGIGAMVQSGGCETDLGKAPTCTIVVPMAVGGAIAAAGFTYSTRVGVHRVSACRTAYEAHEGYAATRHQQAPPRRRGPYANTVGAAVGIAAGVLLLMGVVFVATFSG
jgi:hypothetical protein